MGVGIIGWIRLMKWHPELGRELEVLITTDGRRRRRKKKGHVLRGSEKLNEKETGWKRQLASRAESRQTEWCLTERTWDRRGEWKRGGE